MTLPGPIVQLLDNPPPRSAPTDTGVWFVAGYTEKGPTDPTLITSMSQYVAIFGARTGGSVLYDSVDSYFREGGAKVYVCRVLGPSPVLASHTFNDGSAAAAIATDAASYGVWGNSISVQVVAGGAGGTFVLVVTYNGVEVERSPDLVDQPAAIAWAANSSYIRVRSLGSANDPAVVSAQALTAGTDDHTNAVDVNWKTAIDRASKGYGPGQVSYPGRTTDQAHSDLLAHEASHNRDAILDFPDTPTTATLKTSAAAQRTVDGARFAAGFGPWVVVPGITPGTTRTVPPSAIVAGIIARNDGAGLSPNEPAAGDDGQSVYALNLSQPAWTDAQREDLNNAGVNVLRVMYGGVRIYGWRSLVDPVADPDWVDFGNGRLYTAIAAKVDVVNERFVFKQIDGQGKLFAKYNGQLVGVLLPYYQLGSLFGATPGEAFNVDTGPQVNTPETIAAREVHGSIALRMSPDGEQVILKVSKVATTEAVA